MNTQSHQHIVRSLDESPRSRPGSACEGRSGNVPFRFFRRWLRRKPTSTQGGASRGKRPAFISDDLPQPGGP